MRTNLKRGIRQANPTIGLGNLNDPINLQKFKCPSFAWEGWERGRGVEVSS